MENRNSDLNKVARITILFWVWKILATTLGEVLGDFFSMTLNIGYRLESFDHFCTFYNRTAVTTETGAVSHSCLLAGHHRYHN
jgi:uncharacterized membrane-anchored protein